MKPYGPQQKIWKAKAVYCPLAMILIKQLQRDFGLKYVKQVHCTGDHEKDYLIISDRSSISQELIADQLKTKIKGWQTTKTNLGNG